VFDYFHASSPSRLWRHYVIAMCLMLVVIIISHFLEYFAVQNSQHDAALINKSGKQRLISQQIVLEAETYILGHDEDAKQVLIDRINQFENAHNKLSNSDETAYVLDMLYQSGEPTLDQMVKDYITEARSIVATPPSEEALHDFYAYGSGPLLERLDQAVDQYQGVADRRALSIHKMQEVTLLIAIFILLLEALMIFRPAHNIVVAALARMEDEITQQEAANARLKNFVDIAADLYWESDLNGQITFVEGNLLEQLKGTRRSLLGCLYSDILTFECSELRRMTTALDQLSEYNDIKASFTNEDNITAYLSLNGKPRRDKDGNLLGFLGKAHDVTADAQLIGEITHMAMTDQLTGLRNKRAFEIQLRRELADVSADAPVALLYLDLDEFKPVNDTYGHGAGDHALKAIGARIQNSLRSNDWAARVGGDEFCIVCTNCMSDVASQSIARRIMDHIREPIILPSGDIVEIGASVGIALTSNSFSSSENLVANADTALYAAKRSGKNNVMSYKFIPSELSPKSNVIAFNINR